MATNDNTYASNTLDIYLNDTWYNTLTANAKAAIIDKNITQYQYSYNRSVYNENTHASYADYSTKFINNEVGNRHIYALDVEDIEKYFDGTDSTAGEFSNSDIWTLFLNTPTRPTTTTQPWLRSAYADDSTQAWIISNSFGHLDTDFIYLDYAARPAFQIDLSKISWS